MREPSVKAKVAWNEGRQIMDSLPENCRTNSVSAVEGDMDRFYATAGPRGHGAFGARFHIREAGASHLKEEHRAALKKIAADHGVKFRDHPGGVIELSRQGFEVSGDSFEKGAKEAAEHEELRDGLPSALPHENADVQAVLNAVRKAFEQIKAKN